MELGRVRAPRPGLRGGTAFSFMASRLRWGKLRCTQQRGSNRMRPASLGPRSSPAAPRARSAGRAGAHAPCRAASHTSAGADASCRAASRTGAGARARCRFASRTGAGSGARVRPCGRAARCAGSRSGGRVRPSCGLLCACRGLAIPRESLVRVRAVHSGVYLRHSRRVEGGHHGARQSKFRIEHRVLRSSDRVRALRANRSQQRELPLVPNATLVASVIFVRRKTPSAPLCPPERQRVLFERVPEALLLVNNTQPHVARERVYSMTS